MGPEVQKESKLTKTSVERLAMFTDGVFAIAITLLILEIKIPKHEDLVHAGGLYKYLIHIWPSYLSYTVSFLVVGVYWVNHHWLFTFVKKTDHVYNMLSLIFLMAIAFMPFSSAILGDFIAEEEYRNAAISTFCLSFLLPVFPTIISHLYATYKNRLVDANLSRKFINALTYKLLVSITFTGLAFILSFNYPNISIGVLAFLLIVFMFPPAVPVYDSVDEKMTVIN
jgi:uncharacterized membrane protein